MERQGSGRPLTEAEQTLAAALEAIYADGFNGFAAVAERLTAARVPRPSGATAPWTEAVLFDELAAVNASLDQAYADHGLGA